MTDGFRDDELPVLRVGPDEYTGRYLILSRRADGDDLPRVLRNTAGLTMAAASDFPGGGVDAAEREGADGLYFEQLGIAVASSDPDQLAPLMNLPRTEDLVEIIERERVLYAIQVPRPDRAPTAVPDIADDAELHEHDALVASVSPTMLHPRRSDPDESMHTWGLVATGVTQCIRTGRGVRVAVLDTGFDFDHPDFAGRTIVARSFYKGQTERDVHGHGTHCAGTALGPAEPATRPRYGVASASDLYVGKVIGNHGRGSDGSILSGINWAMINRCRVISMSIGGRVRRGSRHSQVFETAARRAMGRNSLLIAAAGNESNRTAGLLQPVGHPANCPSIMAVGAVDARMEIASFSTRGLDPGGGEVDLVAPGVSVYSSEPMPKRHGRKSGTSMACPHVAGIAALYAEAVPNATARDLWQLLVKHAKPLALHRSDMGAGLVQAPR